MEDRTSCHEQKIRGCERGKPYFFQVYLFLLSFPLFYLFSNVPHGLPHVAWLTEIQFAESFIAFSTVRKIAQYAYYCGTVGQKK
jgi:hypothetical protein